MRIIHISDPHFSDSSVALDKTSDFPGITTWNPDSANRSATISAFLASHKGELATDIVVITGDLTDSGDDGDYAIAHSFVGSLISSGFKVYSVPGNHDYCDYGLLYFAHQSKRNAFVSDIPGACAKDAYPFVVPCGKDWLVLLDSMKAELDEGNYGGDGVGIPKSGDQEAQGKLGEVQRDALDAILASKQADRHSGSKVVVALHHSPYDNAPGGSGILDDGANLLALVGGRIDCLLFGHESPPGVYELDRPGASQPQSTWETGYNIPLVNCVNLQHAGPQYPICVVDTDHNRIEVYDTDGSTPNAPKSGYTAAMLFPPVAPQVAGTYQVGDQWLDRTAKKAGYKVRFCATTRNFAEPTTVEWSVQRVAGLCPGGGQVTLGGFGGPFDYDLSAVVTARDMYDHAQAPLSIMLPKPTVVVEPEYPTWNWEQVLAEKEAWSASRVVIADGHMTVIFGRKSIDVPVKAVCSGFFGDLSYSWDPVAGQHLVGNPASATVQQGASPITLRVDVTDEIGQTATGIGVVEYHVNVAAPPVPIADLGPHIGPWPPDAAYDAKLDPAHPVLNIGGNVVEFSGDKVIADGHTIDLSTAKPIPMVRTPGGLRVKVVGAGTSLTPGE